MFDLTQFNLIKSEESETLCKYQSDLLKLITKETLTDIVLQVSILQTMIPVADYYEAIKILRAYSQDSYDIRVYILGSFLSSTWESNSNSFLGRLPTFISTIEDNQQKSILYYLLAYDIYRKRLISSERDVYTDLLRKSITLSKRFVYNYFRLAKISSNEKAKIIMKKALSNVDNIFDEGACKNLVISDFSTYDSFVNEHILGTHLSSVNYLELKKFYENL